MSDIETQVRLLQARLALDLAGAEGAAPARLEPTGCDLSGARLEAPEVKPVDEEALELRLAERLREVAERRERGRGEAVAGGDDVVLDVIGYARGRLIPFSCRSGWQVEVAPEPSLPGFFESIEGVPVGAAATISVRLPDDAPAEWLRGQTVQLLVEVRRAFEVQPLEGSPEEWPARLGAADLDEAMAALAGEIEEEREAEARGELIERAIDEVAARAQVEIPAELIDREVETAWRRLELPLLRERAFSKEEQAEALQGWLHDAATRLDAERRLRATAGLTWIARERALAVDEDDRRDLLEALAREAGAGSGAAEQGAMDDPRMALQLDALALRLKAIDAALRQLGSSSLDPQTA